MLPIKKPLQVIPCMGSTSGFGLLLNDWGIHHLHITTKLDPDGFVERKRSKSPKPLLFAAFRPDDAYLIDLMQHGDWTHEHLVEVMVREWPNAGLALELKAILTPGQPFSRRVRGDLRNVGMPTFLYIDGKAIAGIGGLTLAGTSAQTSRVVARVASSLRQFLHRVAENPNHVADILRQRGDPMPPELDLHFEFFEMGGFGITEARAGWVWSR